MYAWSKRTAVAPAWSSSRARRSASSLWLIPVACTPGTIPDPGAACRTRRFRELSHLEQRRRMVRLALTGLALSAGALVLALGAGAAASSGPAWTPYDRPAQ